MSHFEVDYYNCSTSIPWPDRLQTSEVENVPIWNFADNPITNCCIKLSANTDIDTDIDAYYV